MALTKPILEQINLTNNDSNLKQLQLTSANTLALVEATSGIKHVVGGNYNKATGVLTINNSDGTSFTIGTFLKSSDQPKGPKGKKGKSGLNGKNGYHGKDGRNGIRGCQGENGDVGSVGDQGIPGIRGNTGPKGATGPKGKRGNVGPRGDTGKRGPQGDKGQTGTQGKQGTAFKSIAALAICGNNLVLVNPDGTKISTNLCIPVQSVPLLVQPTYPVETPECTPAPVQTFSIVADKTSVFRGETVNFTIKAPNVPVGFIGYLVSAGNVHTSDVTDGSLQHTIVKSHNDSETFSHTFSAVGESFTYYLQLRIASFSGAVVAISQTIDVKKLVASGPTPTPSPTPVPTPTPTPVQVSSLPNSQQLGTWANTTNDLSGTWSVDPNQSFDQTAGGIVTASGVITAGVSSITLMELRFTTIPTTRNYLGTGTWDYDAPLAPNSVATYTYTQNTGHLVVNFTGTPTPTPAPTPTPTLTPEQTSGTWAENAGSGSGTWQITGNGPNGTWIDNINNTTGTLQFTFISGSTNFSPTGLWFLSGSSISYPFAWDSGTGDISVAHTTP